MTPEKMCIRCCEVKSMTDFGRDKHSNDGIRVYCKACIKIANKRNYDANSEDRIARSSAWNAANRERFYENHRRYWERRWFSVMDGHHRRRARRADVPDEAVDLEALWTGRCGFCGDAMDRELRYPDPLSASVDHIIPLAKGGPHARGNVQFTHLQCNKVKGLTHAVKHKES